MTKRPCNVLFLCTGNTARSILAEAILRKDGAGRFIAFSAGSSPKGVVNPLTLETLTAFGYPIDGLRSKSWSEFAEVGAPRMDVVITVCDNAAGEACPLWPGQPVTAHWSVEDPAAVEGNEIARQRAFDAAFHVLRSRIAALLALPVERMERVSLSRHLEQIGAMEGTASPGEVR
jgi:arsenate reductase